MIVFHSTTAEAARSILAGGFRDSTGIHLMSTALEEGKGFREWLVPAEVLNAGRIIPPKRAFSAGSRAKCGLSIKDRARR